MTRDVDPLDIAAIPARLIAEAQAQAARAGFSIWIAAWRAGVTAFLLVTPLLERANNPIIFAAGKAFYPDDRIVLSRDSRGLLWEREDAYWLLPIGDVVGADGKAPS